METGLQVGQWGRAVPKRILMAPFSFFHPFCYIYVPSSSYQSYSFVLKMAAAYSFQMLVTLYQITCCHSPVDGSPYYLVSSPLHSVSTVLRNQIVSQEYEDKRVEEAQQQEKDVRDNRDGTSRAKVRHEPFSFEDGMIYTYMFRVQVVYFDV
jgi:hypothetical protein